MRLILATIICILGFGRSIACTVPPVVGAIRGTTGTICVGVADILTNDTTGGIWVSGDTTIIRINRATGIFMPLRAGVDTIRYILSDTCGADTAVVVITVNPLPGVFISSSLSVGSYTTFSVASGTSVSLSGVAATRRGTTDTLNGVAVGNAILMLTSSAGCLMLDTIQVDSFPIVGPIIVPSSIHGCVGNSGTLIDSTRGGSWSTSTPAIVTVTATSGALRLLSPGIGIITYTYRGSTLNGWSAVRITVDQTPTAITGPSRFCVNDTMAYATDRYWSVFSSTRMGVNWTSSDTTVLKFLPGSGSFDSAVSLHYGSAVITATSQNTGCFVTMNVSIDTVPVIAPLTASPTTLCSGQSSIVHVNVPTGVWRVTNTSTGTVSPSGIFTGFAAGTDTVIYTITNTCGAFSQSIGFTINPIPSISVITGPTTIYTGTPVTLNNATPGGTWSSSNTAVATVGSTTGVVTPVSVGLTNISYTLSNSFGCSNFVTIPEEIRCPVGVLEVPNANGVKVYPVPCTESLNVTLPELTSNSVEELTVFDAYGRNAFHSFFNGANQTNNLFVLDVKDWATGVYVLELRNQGQVLKTMFVKQ